MAGLSVEDKLKIEREILNRESDKEFEFRFLEREDYDKGFMETLS